MGHVGLEIFMSKQFKTALILVFGIFLGISASLTGNVLANKEEAKGLPLDQLRNFSDIFSRIKSDYVEDVEDEVLL
jgi:carboxyl-terminal processing protease